MYPCVVTWYCNTSILLYVRISSKLDNVVKEGGGGGGGSALNNEVAKNVILTNGRVP